MPFQFPSGDGPPQQKWDPVLYDSRHSYVYGYGEDLLNLLSAQPGERILDVGCGNGHLTKRIAEYGAQVVGIDSSSEMIEAARSAHPEIEFLVWDVTDLSFTENFDAVFSNAALHWEPEAERAVMRIANALRVGGRFVAEFGGRGNIARIHNAVEKIIRARGGSPPATGWYFPSIGEYAPLLEAHGLAVESAWLFDRPTAMEAGEEGLQSWLEMFGGRLLGQLPFEAKQGVIRDVEDLLRPVLWQDGHWTVDYRRIRIVARKD